MKHIFFASAIGFFSILAPSSNTSAQKVDEIVIANSDKGMLAFDGSLMDNSSSVKTVNVSQRALKDLNKFYRPEGTVTWTEVPNGIVAIFKVGEVLHHVFYSKKGRWTGSHKSYGESLMPKDLRHEVRQSYYDFKIAQCEELEIPDSSGEPTYIVTIKDENSIKRLRVFQGSIEELRTIKL